jgi:hypothetical protein
VVDRDGFRDVVGVVSRPAFETPAEDAKFRELTKTWEAPADKAKVADTWQAWKSAHPQEYAELEKMRAEVLKRQGYNVGPVLHGTPDKKGFAEFDANLFLVEAKFIHRPLSVFYALVEIGIVKAQACPD